MKSAPLFLLFATSLSFLSGACAREAQFSQKPDWKPQDHTVPNQEIHVYFPEDAPRDLAAPDQVELLSDLVAESGLDVTPEELVEDLPAETDELDDLWSGGDSADAQGEVVVPPEEIPPQEISYDEYGGFADIPVTEPTGYFGTGLAGGRAWLTTPSGNAFFSTGLSAFRFGGPTGEGIGYSPAALNDYRNFVEQTGESMQNAPAAVLLNKALLSLELGLSSLGGWSNGAAAKVSGTLAGTYSLGFADGVQSTSHTAHPIPAVNFADFPDVFHPDFPLACQEYATHVISQANIDDAWNLGYFMDNELHWWGQAIWLESTTTTLADDFIALGPDTPGKQAFVLFMSSRWDGNLEAFNQAYALQLDSFDDLASLTELAYDFENPVHFADRMAFVEEIADHYFSAASQARKDRDPNHLNLCVRFASVAPLPVVRKMAEYCDVITLNDYYIPNTAISIAALGAPSEQRWESWVQAVFDQSGPKPFMITEWGVRGDDTGLPNTYGAGQTVPTQQDRIETIHHVTHWLVDREHDGIGYVSGWHWFMHEDQPPTGRWDGEDSNYGVVTLRNEAYLWLQQAMKAFNLAIDNRLVHGVAPTVLPPPEGPVTVTFPNSQTAQISWSKVESAKGYRVTALSHPAGVEGRTFDQVSTTGTTVTMETTHLGNGRAWFAVEAVHPELLTAGFRVSPPVMLTPCIDLAQPPSLDEVLACDTMCHVHYDNQPAFPNEKAGLAYARLSDPQQGQPGHSIAMEFVPSSLGLVTSNLPEPHHMEVVFDLPEPVAISVGQTLHFEAWPGHAVTPGKQLVAASDFMVVRLCDEQGECPLSFPLALQELAAGQWQEAVLTITQDLELDSLVFRVDLYQPDLPMEHRLILFVDSIQIQ